MPDENGIVLFCSRAVTPRLTYILKTLFYETAGLSFSITDQPGLLQEKGTAVLSYGLPPLPGIPFIPSVGLLFETGTGAQKPGVQYWSGMPVMFHTGDEGALLPFDIFAASFWLLSRYEEYQPFSPDIHGRFPAGESLLHLHRLLQFPLVNAWLDTLVQKIKVLYPFLRLSPPSYRYIPTIDVDSAWAYLHKPAWRQFMAIARSFFRGEYSDIWERISVLAGKRQDPFDSWSLISEIHRDHVPPVFFILIGNYGKYDKNLSPGNRHLANLVKHLATHAPIGIHPSYRSGDEPSLLGREKARLEKITQKPVVASRQHFLRLSIPSTYLNLVRNGIREDYTMGFADQPGFRAGTCSPFRFYDLEEEKEHDLLIYPLAIMDGTLRDYLQMESHDALKLIMQLAETTRRYHGVFVTLWHNESLGGQKRWEGWTALYREMVDYCSFPGPANSLKK